MAKVFGKEQTKAELLRKVGNLDQIACVRPIEYIEGRASGLKAFEVHNGELEFTVIKDRCMDIGAFKYKGVPMQFWTKPGLASPLWSYEGEHAFRSIIGGMMFTCGLRNIGPGLDFEGEKHIMHGRIRNTPAEYVGSNAFWDGDDYVIQLTGRAREATLFGENLVLSRTIETRLGTNAVTISDEIENQGFEEQPFMILYHFNVGYPLLDDGARLILPPNETVPRDEFAIEVEKANMVHAPVDGYHERVYAHHLQAKGRATAALVNKSLGLGLAIEFDAEALPNITQWKSMGSGDYAMGIEPCNCHVSGIGAEKANGTLQTIKPLEKKKISLSLRPLEGEELANLCKSAGL